jgi:hypothetical protein
MKTTRRRYTGEFKAETTNGLYKPVPSFVGGPR